MVHVAPHFSLCAPAYGSVGGDIYHNLYHELDFKPILIETQMAHRFGRGPIYDAEKIIREAGLNKLETNDDLSKLIDYLIAQDSTRGIIMAAAVCDWEPDTLLFKKKGVHYATDKFGKDVDRLSTSEGRMDLYVKPADKIISKIRKERKDIFLVGFKATAGKTKEETYAAGLHSLKANSANIVFANDVHTKMNVIVTPEEYPYYYEDRTEATVNLCKMIAARTKLTFTRTVVIDNNNLVNPLKLKEEQCIPYNFIAVLAWLINEGVYKPFRGNTTGHFGCKVVGQSYKTISSVRKKNHNNVLEEGMVPIYESQNDVIVAGGAKPSVGEHTQQAIYNALGDKVHSVVHFHCDLRENSGFPEKAIKSQFNFECGSNQCAENAVSGMTCIYPGVYACHLEGHGPNIAFHKEVYMEDMTRILRTYWNLEEKSGGNIKESD